MFKRPCDELTHIVWNGSLDFFVNLKVREIGILLVLRPGIAALGFGRLNAAAPCVAIRAVRLAGLLSTRGSRN